MKCFVGRARGHCCRCCTAAVMQRRWGTLATYEDAVKAAQVMGVDLRCTDKALRERYVELVKKHHPDAGGDTNSMSQITHANELLSNLSAKERERIATRAKFERSYRFASTYSGASSASSPRTGFGSSPRARGSVVPVVEELGTEPTWFRQSAASALVCALVLGVVGFVLLRVVAAMRRTSAARGEQDAAAAQTVATLDSLHEQRRLVNQEIAALKHQQTAEHWGGDSSPKELQELLELRKALNARIELVACGNGALQSKQHKPGNESAGGAVIVSLAMMAALFMLPRWCKVAR